MTECTNTPATPMQNSSAQEDYKTGLSFLEQKEYGQAANAFHNAKLACEEAGDDAGCANACFRLAETCAAQGQHDRALEFLDSTEEIIRRQDDLMSLMSIRKQRIVSLRALGRYDAAIAIYLEMLDCYQGMNNPASSVETLLGMAETYQEAREIEKAADAYTTAANIHAHFGHQKEAESLRRRAQQLLEG